MPFLKAKVGYHSSYGFKPAGSVWEVSQEEHDALVENSDFVATASDPNATEQELQKLQVGTDLGTDQPNEGKLPPLSEQAQKEDKQVRKTKEEKE